MARPMEGLRSIPLRRATARWNAAGSYFVGPLVAKQAGVFLAMQPRPG